MTNLLLDLNKLLPIPECIINILTNDSKTNYIFNVCYKKLLNDNTLPTSEASNNNELYLIDLLLEKVWENLNTGHWSEVPIESRKTYSIASFLKVLLLLGKLVDNDSIKKCLSIIDIGLLLGAPLAEPNSKMLTECAEILNKSISYESSSEAPLKRLKIEQSFVNSLNELSVYDIPILEKPSIEYFRINNFNPEAPALLKNCLTHWPALTKWTDLNYLLNIAGERTVPIEIGTQYSSENWSQELMKFKDFIKRQFKTEEPNHIEYLAQHELFDQIPELKKDILIPDYCCLTKSTDDKSVIEPDIKAWLGPKGTVSPLHQDPKNNLLCQIFGSKLIILASHEDTDFLYKFNNKMLSNTSEINLDAKIDYTKYPLLKNVKFYKLILNSGDTVYIPPKWWHFVKALSQSFSVSYWWE